MSYNFTPNRGKTFVSLPEYERSRKEVLENGQTRILGDRYPVVPQEKRDPTLWRRDSRVKAAKKALDCSIRGTINLVEQFNACFGQLHANLHLTIGKHRL